MRITPPHSAFVNSRILRYSHVRSPRNFSVPRPFFNGRAAKVAGKRRWFALCEKRRRLAPSRKGSSMIVLWHSIAFGNIMMVDQVPFFRYYAIKLFCVEWSLFPHTACTQHQTRHQILVTCLVPCACRVQHQVHETHTAHQVHGAHTAHHPHSICLALW